MNLLIKRVVDRGDISKERLVIRSNSEMDIGKFILFQSRYVNENEVSSKLRNAFWLPDLMVGAGEQIIIYTKAGTDKSRLNEDTSKTHFIYRGLASAIWEKEEDCAVLVEISDWTSKKF